MVMRLRVADREKCVQCQGNGQISARPPSALLKCRYPVSSASPVKGRHNQTDLPGRAPQASRFRSQALPVG